MKITKALAHILETKLSQPFAYSRAWYDTRTAMLVEIETDAGLTGWGECYGPARMTAAVVQNIAPWLIGEAPLRTDVLWQMVYARLRDHGQKGVVIQGLSGVDIALWDNKGKFTRYGSRDLFASHALDIAQPDTCAAGGLTECKKIADMSEAFGIRYNPHVWGAGIAIAASLQLLAVLPSHTPTSLAPLEPMLEFDRTEHPNRQAVLTEPIEHMKGVVRVPDGPGLGIEIDRTA